MTEGIDIVCSGMGLLPVSLSCDDGVIDIHYANWGRTVPYADMCPLFVGFEQNTNCYHNVYDNFDLCCGLKQCSINQTQNLPNPCYSTARYIEVRYSCKGKHTPVSQIFHKTAHKQGIHDYISISQETSITYSRVCWVIIHVMVYMNQQKE